MSPTDPRPRRDRGEASAAFAVDRVLREAGSFRSPGSSGKRPSAPRAPGDSGSVGCLPPSAHPPTTATPIAAIPAPSSFRRVSNSV